MGKVKLSLVSGAVVEKPLISAFKANENNYVVLDNEMNGSMGLPIILVSKLINNKLSKIVDQNEWQNVKELLKGIIAGNKVEYMNISNEIAADDIYFTQLTLPVPSFDALKNAYVVTDEGESAPVVPEVQSVETPNVMPEVNTVSTPEPTITMPETPSVEPTSVVDNNFSQTIQNELNQPVMPDIPVDNSGESSVSVTPSIDVSMPSSNEVSSTVEVSSEAANDNQFADEKEAFLKACENMFDALVKKFNNK